MSLDFEYGINVNNRFLDLTGHDEDPDEFIANQSKADEKPKPKEAKKAASGSNKKTNTAASAPTPAPASNNKTTKESTAPKSNKDEQRKSTKVTFTEGNNQEPRSDSARGPRGSGRRGGAGGSDRPPSEGSGRGGYGFQRPPRTHRPDSQRPNNETGNVDQAGDKPTEFTSEGQSGEFRGRGGRGGRGSRGRGVYEVRRGGGGRGRGPRGGRGGYSGNQAEGDGQFQSGNFEQETGNFEHHGDTRPRSEQHYNRGATDSDPAADSTGDNQFIAPSGRGGYRPRTFRNNRNYGAERGHDLNRDGFSQSENRRHHRQHDRERRNEVSGVKAFEKKDGDGANNWGNKTENPDETVVPEETDEATAAAAAAAATDAAGGSTNKPWAAQVEEAEQMTLDEYKKQQEDKKKLVSEKLPALKPRLAGEGEDPKTWKNYEQVYRKKNDDDETEEEVDNEEQESEEEEEQEEEASGKKKILTIPLTFKDETAMRGGPRRGSGRGRPRENRREREVDFHEQRPVSSEQSGDQYNEGRTQSANLGSGRGSRPNYPRTEYRRRPYYPTRGDQSRPAGGHSAQINLNNPEEFPSLAKQS